MKKIYFIFVFCLFSFIVKSQNYYKAVLSELYTYNSKTSDWDLYQKNSDVNIPIVVETNFITIQALSPSMYRVYDGTKEPLITNSFSGYSYTAKNLKTEKYVKIDILKSNASNFMIISIIDKDELLNYRYFLESN